LLEIDRILELLATDRAWHSIDELAEKTGLPVGEIIEVVQFLATHEFILLKEQGKRAKIEDSLNLFLTRIHDEEKLSAR
jgi:DNA-binding IclR family transcriptional regulator